MSAEYDAIVVGCGTMGAAACLELARRGRRVLGVDRFTPPHKEGSHHGAVRMFRMSYYEHPAYVPWLKRSLEGWRRLERETDARLLELTGALYMGLPGSELISGCLRSAREHGLAHEQLDEKDLAARFPMFRLPRGMVGLLERDAGFVWCERAVEAMLSRAKALGAELRTQEPVTAWTCDGEKIEAHGSERIVARSLVLTAGPWSGELLRGLGVPLAVTRQVQGWLAPQDPRAFLPERFPCWAIDIGGGALFYGFPALPNSRGQLEVKVARHAKGPIVEPGADCRRSCPEDAEDFLSLAREYLPRLADRLARHCTCLYTNSPDGHFIVDRHPLYPNVAFGAGFSGHGFKLAPSIGEILARLAAGEEHCEPFFALARLKGRGGAAQ